VINFIDEKGIKHSAIVECKKTKGVNGEKSLSGTIYTNDEILEGIGRGWRLEFENEKYCLTYVYPIDEGNRIVVEFDAVHEFFFDLNKKVVYSELNGSNTAKAYLDLIFNGSGYSYLIEVNVPSFEKESFGMRNRLDLFKEFISDTGVEFSVNGKVVRILEKVGSNLSTIVKKGFNLNELRIEKDPGSFITYKKGFGAWVDEDDHSKGRLEVEYLSPLASIYGKLEGDPIVDERYKVASNFETRLKNDVESSYGISVDIDMEDLTKAGYEYEQPHEGDYIMAINKDLGFEQKIRIMSYETSYDTNGNIIDHKVSCGSDNIIRKSIKEDDDFRKEIQAGLEGAISTSNKAWVSANGKTTVFEGPDEPTATAIGDMWFQIDGDKKIMRIWNGYEWKPVFNPGEIENKIDQAEKDIAQNVIDIESTLAKATQAELDAGFSKTLAEDAKRLAGLAEGNAQEALTKANTSVTDASTALTNATKAFNKSFKSSTVAYATSTNGNTPPTTGWASTHATPSPDVYIWTRTTIVLNDNTSVVSYSVGKIGAKGDQGLKGDPGANAPTITSVEQQFYLSTSKSTQTGGSWLATVPVWSSGKYYWVRVATTYSNGATTTSTPVLDNALNDSLVTALEVKTANQNLSTTVSQHATLIESKANSTTVDAIAGRVTNAEGSISTIAGQIELKANSTDVQTLTGRVSTAEGNITTQAGQIALKANTTDVNTLTGRVATAEGKITTQAGQIALKANQTAVDTLTGRVSATEASIKVTDGKVTTLTTKTDGHTTSIGLLETSYSGLNSTVTQVKNNLEGMEIGGRNLLKNSDREVSAIGGREFVQFADLAPIFDEHGINEVYSLSLDLKSSDISKRSIIQVYMQNGNGSKYSFVYAGVSVTKEYQRFKFEGLKPSLSNTTETRAMLAFYGTYDTGNFPIIRRVKIEKGNKATDWSPAPEDYTTVTAFSALEQNLSGFKTTVANTYADKTTVTALANQWTQTTELANGHTSAINSLGEQLNLRVTKGELISQINLSPESILIASKRIQIKGDTYIDNSVIKTAHIADLAVSGAKIANATIGSAKIVSLDANKINAGTVNGLVISSTSATGQFSVQGQNAVFRNTATGRRVEINETGVDIYNVNGTLRSQFNQTVINTGIIGTNTYNIYLGTGGVDGTEGEAQGGEVRVVRYDSTPGGGAVTDYVYRPIRAEGFVGNYVNVNTPFSTVSHLYLRPRFSTGEVRVTGSGSTTAYQSLRASGIFANTLDDNSLTGGTHIYVRPASGGELRVTRPGTTDQFQNIRASVFYATAIDTTATHMYVRGTSGGEVRATVSGTTSTYIPVRASSFPTGSMEEFKTDIKEYTDSALSIIRESTIYDYKLKSELESGRLKTRIGLVIGKGYNTPNEIIDGDGVEQYAMNSLGWKAIQELDVIATKASKIADEVNFKVIKLIANSSSYGQRLYTLETEVFRLKKRIEELEKIA
jgi:hypothetical protein